MSHLGFLDQMSEIIFDDEVMRHYFRSCNVAPIWIEVDGWGRYTPGFNNGTGQDGLVRFTQYSRQLQLRSFYCLI